VQEWGTGAINVEGCRVPGNDHASAWDRPVSTNIGAGSYISDGTQHVIDISANKPSGRWPANLIHDGSEEVEALTGSAARFFYCAKASKAERDAGCDGMEERRGGSLNMRTDGHSQANGMDTGPRRNHHPTVKPTALMQYLCRLVTPSGGTVLDPFTGSGSTGRGAILEGFNFIGIEREAEYVEIARARIAEAERRHSESLVSA
jgi:site-specific DNA-methyltransferase (adenine-specific)